MSSGPEKTRRKSRQSNDRGHHRSPREPGQRRRENLGTAQWVREPAVAEQIDSWALFLASNRKQRMKDFSNASFSPDQIEAMDRALEAAVATLPHPVSSKRVHDIAESILRNAKDGERNPMALRTMALVELQIRTDEK
jgi:hypothetical protein